MERKIATETCLEALLEAFVLVRSRLIGVQELVVQAFLCPRREGAVDERGVDEEVDAVVQAVEGKRRRGKLEDREFKLERKSVGHPACHSEALSRQRGMRVSPRETATAPTRGLSRHDNLLAQHGRAYTVPWILNRSI